MSGFGSDERFADFLVAQGYILPTGAPSPAVLRQRGSTYLDGTYEKDLPGYRTGGLAQERAFPRTGAEAYGQAIPSDVVPVQWEHASYFAALHEANNPGSLSVAATAAGAVKRRKIDVIEVEFFEGSSNAAADATVRLSVVEGLLAPFLTQPMPAIFVV